MTFAREKDGERRLRSETAGEADITLSPPTRRRRKADSPEIGNALRTVYQQTIEEKIPDDLLDLLGKLG